MTFSPAAYDTISRFFADTGTSPDDYDAIFTGDLGYIGSELLLQLFNKDGVNLADKHFDCGKLLYDRKKQDVHAGGSGCGCVGSVTACYIVPAVSAGKLKNVLVCGTGALLSTVSTGQGESIPSVAHIIHLQTA